MNESAEDAGISVVVPVYNSADTLAPLVGDLERVLVGSGLPFEVILVNDGSRDSSWARIVELAARFSYVRGVDLMRNYGQHSAVLAGVREARYAVVVTMDDDLQHPPEEIPKLLAKLGEGYDVVYGVPTHEQHGLWRDLASRLTKAALAGAMGVANARNVSAFRAFRTRLRDAFAACQGPFVSMDALLSWGTTRFGAVQVRHEPSKRARSNYTLATLLTHALNMATGFSALPLQVASVVGFVCTLGGAAVLVYVIGRYLVQGGSVPGFSFLASIIAVFSGAQLFTLGVMGEYLARVHFRTMGRPALAVRQRVASSEAARRSGAAPE